MIRKRGKLIVIDGSDGSGKATQARLLVQSLRQKGKSVCTLDFPQYKNNFMGGFVGDCLAGKHGDFLDLDPHIASVVYAADRYESKEKIKKWLADGRIIILDRYVSANQIHQGGKIASGRERVAFLAWLNELEYNVFKLPHPNKVIYLDVPISTSLRLLSGDGKKLDKAEEDQEYLNNSRKSALWLSKREKNWKRVNCVKCGLLRPINDIHKEIMTLI